MSTLLQEKLADAIIENAKRGTYVELSGYRGKFDVEKYSLLLKKSYLNLFLPLNPSLFELSDLVEGKTQLRLVDFLSEQLLLRVASRS